MSLFRDIVAKHHRDSEAILVAARDPCITIAYDERANVVGRSFRIAAPEGLARLEPRASWIMAILLCPGDDTREVAEWAKKGAREPRRVLFYLHPTTDARKALASWRDAGLPVLSTWTVDTWKALHTHFGAAWNVRVFDDFRGRE